MKKDFRKWKRKIQFVNNEIKQMPAFSFNESYYLALAEYYKSEPWEESTITTNSDSSFDIISTDTSSTLVFHSGLPRY